MTDPTARRAAYVERLLSETADVEEALRQAARLEAFVDGTLSPADVLERDRLSLPAPQSVPDDPAPPHDGWPGPGDVIPAEPETRPCAPCTAAKKPSDGRTKLRGAAATVLPVMQEMIRAGDRITTAIVAQRTGIHEQTVYQAIQRLARDGYIVKSGRGRAVRYWLPEDAPEPSTRDEPKCKRRFGGHRELDPENVDGLPDDHEAVTEGRTLFPGTVVDPDDSPALLVSGKNSSKIGSHVVKGPWKGMPIYILTLEERATCPRECQHWGTCFGNGMPRARRHRHGKAFEKRLAAELADKNAEHPSGFVVRVHVLGDFYSTAYAEMWSGWLFKFPALRVFGYTAHPRDSEIGATVNMVNMAHPGRCYIRFSGDPAPFGATTIWRKPEAAVVEEGLVCPMQTGATDACGTCGLCWSDAMRDRCIVFVAHGRLGKKAQHTPAADPERISEEARKPWPSERPQQQAPEPVDPAPEVEAKPKSEWPKSRRCQGCQSIFESHAASDQYCGGCRTVVVNA